MRQREYIARMKRNRKFCDRVLKMLKDDRITLCDMHLFLSENVGNLRDVADIAKSTLNDLIDYENRK